MVAKGYSILALTFVVILLAGCATVQEALNLKKPTARLVDVKFEEAKLNSATLVFDIEVDNRYPVALPLTNFDYSLSSGPEKFLSGSANSQTTVPATSRKTVSLPAKINYMEMLKALTLAYKEVKAGSKIPYSAELGLSVDTPALGRIRLPLKKEGELALPNVSGFEVKDLWNIIKPK